MAVSQPAQFLPWQGRLGRGIVKHGHYAFLAASLGKSHSQFHAAVFPCLILKVLFHLWLGQGPVSKGKRILAALSFSCHQSLWRKSASVNGIILFVGTKKCFHGSQLFLLHGLKISALHNVPVHTAALHPLFQNRQRLLKLPGKGCHTLCV